MADCDQLSHSVPGAVVPHSLTPLLRGTASPATAFSASMADLMMSWLCWPCAGCRRTDAAWWSGTVQSEHWQSRMRFVSVSCSRGVLDLVLDTLKWS